MIITESYKTWKLPISDLEKIEACTWGSKKALKRSNFTTTCHVLKFGGLLNFIYVYSVYMCKKEAEVEWKLTLKVTGGIFQLAPLSEAANISTDELWKLKKEKAGGGTWWDTTTCIWWIPWFFKRTGFNSSGIVTLNTWTVADSFINAYGLVGCCVDN